eukprot:409465-Amphidinium_carterae.1
MLSLIYEHFATESQKEQLHQIQDVIDLRCGGEAELEGFWLTWTFVVGDVGGALSVEVLRDVKRIGTKSHNIGSRGVALLALGMGDGAAADALETSATPAAATDNMQKGICFSMVKHGKCAK